MITLMVNESLRFKDIEAYGEPVQLCSPEGNVLGVFTPTEIRPRRRVRTPDEEAAYWAEAERRADAPGEDIPLHEVYTRLLPLTTDESARALLEAKIDRLLERDKRCNGS
jgi:hypothetical protein